ncbi:uncharacterized protein V6R79_025542 [Siganus canaliculatus]
MNGEHERTVPAASGLVLCGQRVSAQVQSGHRPVDVQLHTLLHRISDSTDIHHADGGDRNGFSRPTTPETLRTTRQRKEHMHRALRRRHARRHVG